MCAVGLPLEFSVLLTKAAAAGKFACGIRKQASNAACLLQHSLESITV
jgi:hypothetical protein